MRELAPEAPRPRPPLYSFVSALAPVAAMCGTTDGATGPVAGSRIFSVSLQLLVDLRFSSHCFTQPLEFEALCVCVGVVFILRVGHLSST